MDEKNSTLTNTLPQIDIVVRETQTGGLRINYEACGEGESAFL